MKRILVLGPGGAGKSTFARQLGERWGLPVIHLDAHHWKPSWTSPDKQEWNARVAELLCGNAWIMDGNYSGTLAARLAACDTVIFLDLPRMICLRRVIKRRLLYRWQGRPDMAPDCPEKIDREFMAWIWNYPTRTRPKVLTLITEQVNGKAIFHLRRPAEVSAFLAA